MPYIPNATRALVEIPDVWAVADNPGELNYQITRILDTYTKEHGMSYATINEAIGVLECAKLELYRRIAAPYEDKKREENGDVYSV